MASTGLMMLAALLSALALLISIGLLWQTTGRRGLPGCGAKSNCQQVTASRWAKVGRIPVAVGGIVVYLAMFSCTLLLTQRIGFSDFAHATLFALAMIAIAAAIWFWGV